MTVYKSVPHKNVKEMLQYRSQMQAIRRTGHVARPEKVLHRVAVKERSVNFRGGEPVTVARLLLRGVLQGKIPVKGDMLEYAIIAQKFNAVWELTGLSKTYPKIWGENDAKNAKRGAWEPGCILPNSVLENLVEQLAVTLNADPSEAKRLIFAREEFEAIRTILIEEVITAVMNAHGQGVEPFLSLYNKGFLPDRQTIEDTFRQYLSEDQIKTCIKRSYIPGRRPSGDVKKLKRIFYSLGIPNSKALLCAKSVAPPAFATMKKRYNPGKKRCAEHFVAALYAVVGADMNYAVPSINTIFYKLKKYGLSRKRCSQLKKGKFNANFVKSTPQNRQQIQSMARSFGYDPMPLIDVLLEK